MRSVISALVFWAGTARAHCGLAFLKAILTNRATSNRFSPRPATVASEASTQTRYQPRRLAVDVHAASIVMVCMIHGAKPQPRARLEEDFGTADEPAPIEGIRKDKRIKTDSETER